MQVLAGEQTTRSIIAQQEQVDDTEQMEVLYMWQTLFMAATDSIYGCNRFYIWLQQTRQMAATDSFYGCNRFYIWLQQTRQHGALTAQQEKVDDAE